MSPEQVTEPVTGSLDDELDQFAAVFTILGSLHYQVPDADHLHELLQMIDEWPLSRPRSPSRMEEGLQMWRLSREEAESRQVVVADHDHLYGDSAVALVPPYESAHRNREGWSSTNTPCKCVPPTPVSGLPHLISTANLTITSVWNWSSWPRDVYAFWMPEKTVTLTRVTRRSR